MEQLNAVHPAGYVDRIRAVSEAGGGAFDPEVFDLRTVNQQLAHLWPSPWD